jgi:FkbM family methyltransferase
LIKKINSFFLTLKKLKLSGSLKYYFIKYFSNNNEKDYKIHVPPALTVNLKNSAGDLCTLYEIFVEEDYKLDDFDKNQELKILDIGANIGYFSLYASINFRNSTVYSFEPFPLTFGRLSGNIELNQLDNIKLYPFAVSDREGKVDFYSIDWAGCNTMIGGKFDEGHFDKSVVDCISFKKVFELTGTKEFDFAKIDCEGSEYQIILNSPDELLIAVKEYSIEVHLDKIYKVDDLIRKFKSLNYEVDYNGNILNAKKGKSITA